MRSCQHSRRQLNLHAGVGAGLRIAHLLEPGRIEDQASERIDIESRISNEEGARLLARGFEGTLRHAIIAPQQKRHRRERHGQEQTHDRQFRQPGQFIILPFSERNSSPRPKAKRTTSQRIDAVLALARIRTRPHADPSQPRPLGDSFAQRGRFRLWPLLLAMLGSAALVGCDASDSKTRPTQEFVLPEDWQEQHPVLSPNAKTEAHFGSLAERELIPNPVDGQGRARLEAVTAITTVSPSAEPKSWRRGEAERARPIVPAASIQRIELSFEVGGHGIDEGGLIFVLPEPSWSWSEAQVTNPRALGYTTATARQAGVELVPAGPGASFQVVGRALEPGERIDIVVGAGPRGTRVDEFAGRDSEILIAVDADGDGTRRWLPAGVWLDIAACAGVRIVAFGPAEVIPGDPIEVSVAIVDANGNRALWPVDADDESGFATGTFAIKSIDGPSLAELGLPESVTTRSRPGDPVRIRFSSPKRETTIRLSISLSTGSRGTLDGFEATVNPIVVRNSTRHLVWGDLHGHSGLSDGTGTADDYFRYARDVARLDVIALTDHDHWSVPSTNTRRSWSRSCSRHAGFMTPDASSRSRAMNGRIGFTAIATFSISPMRLRSFRRSIPRPIDPTNSGPPCAADRR